ncbi:MAG: hypothetical protein A2X64_01675 [Ignavibacteria bacterium GWF2_33_9]|nr:MAG: hypothetical protein A2X64_01675 [Ignavibacteria bacterium GWF2_33_9]
MSRSLNKVLLIGNVGVDPILKETPGGVPVTSFRMATSQTWKDRNGMLKEQTDWHTVVAWRGLAQIVDKLIHRGSRIFVEGRLQTRTIEDKLTQKQKQIVEILADNILLLDSKSKNFSENHEKMEFGDYHVHNESEFESHDDFYDDVDSIFDDDFHLNIDDNN